MAATAANRRVNASSSAATASIVRHAVGSDAAWPNSAGWRRRSVWMSLIVVPSSASTTARSRTTAPGACVSHERTASSARRSCLVNPKRLAARRSNPAPVWLSNPRPSVLTTNRSPLLLRF